MATVAATADTEPRTSRAPERKRVTVAKRRQHRAAYLLVMPFFLIFVAMIIVPLAYAGYLSFFREQLVGGVSFAGFDNYTRAFQDAASSPGWHGWRCSWSSRSRSC